MMEVLTVTKTAGQVALAGRLGRRRRRRETRAHEDYMELVALQQDVRDGRYDDAALLTKREAIEILGISERSFERWGPPADVVQGTRHMWKLGTVRRILERQHRAAEKRRERA